MHVKYYDLQVMLRLIFITAYYTVYGSKINKINTVTTSFENKFAYCQTVAFYYGEKIKFIAVCAVYSLFRKKCFE